MSDILQAQASSSTVPPSSDPNALRPSAHAQRYDRQLRLWASSGQSSLESARIAVLGASYLGASVLKNLVLPGLGHFDLVDARLVDEADLGSHFFVEKDAKGKSRADEVVRTLCELNPEVKGRAVVQEPQEWIEEAHLDDYTLVIAVNQPARVLAPLTGKAWEAKAGLGVPIVTVRGAGLLGQIGIQAKAVGIIETHPDNTVDLRLVHPWDELKAYADAYDVDTKDSMAHTHTPYVVILLRKLQEWKESHSGQLPQPSSSDDRKAFVALVNSFRWGESADEENVDEAISVLGQHVWRPIRAGNASRVPDEISALMKEDQCVQISDKSSNFWLLLHALRAFVEHGDGSLPLTGSLPDMKALSATYVELQRIYRAKAQRDVQTLRRHLDEALQRVGLLTDAISQDEVESFAKHAAYLRLIRGKRWTSAIDEPGVESIRNAMLDPINPVTFPWHVAFVASQDFYDTHARRYPGSSGELSASISGSSLVGGADADKEQGIDFEKDEEELARLATERLAKWNVADVMKDEEQAALIEDACAELTRSGHADLPSTTALLGGLVAQEVIKLLTRQYVPFDNTAIYDGIKQAIGVYRL